jgi:hypothetical protein
MMPVPLLSFNLSGMVILYPRQMKVFTWAVDGDEDSKQFTATINSDDPILDDFPEDGVVIWTFQTILQRLQQLKIVITQCVQLNTISSYDQFILRDEAANIHLQNAVLEAAKRLGYELKEGKLQWVFLPPN